MLTKLECKEISASVNDKKYQYYDIGNGAVTLFFLHGLAGGKAGAPHFYAPLTKKYRCIFLDFPAHQDLPLQGMENADDFADYVINFVDYLNVDKFGFVGFSFGGFIALKIAEKLLKRGKAVPVVLWAVPLNLGAKFMSPQAWLYVDFMHILPKNVYKFLIKSSSLRTLFKIMGVKLSAADLVALTKFDNTSLKKIKTVFNTRSNINLALPLLLVFGTKDIFVKKECFEHIDFSDCCDKKKVLIECGGHFGTREGRNKALEEIEKFFAVKI